ncbi:MAG: FliA/WhiG family RNA polymerase sigma factor [Fimbriimonadales bacterium]|nr:FliA/WhiG family RNA polymerase sigma factor [Fimbriimonadales bacterium]
MSAMTLAQLQKCWKAFKEDGDVEARNALIRNYAYLVKITAGRVVSALPPGLDREDLISAGTIGLIKAVDQFDPNREVKFETYAIALIRGAILEMLRSEDWVPRSIREKLKALERAQFALEAKLGRPPTEEELAQALNISQEDLRTLIQQATRTAVLSLDEVLSGHEGEDNIKFSEILADERSSPEVEAQSRELLRRLQESIDRLPDRERLVIGLYYYEGLTFKEIGEVLRVSESRVYQLHTQAMTRMRAHFQEQGGGLLPA